MKAPSIWLLGGIQLRVHNKFTSPNRPTILLVILWRWPASALLLQSRHPGWTSTSRVFWECDNKKQRVIISKSNHRPSCHLALAFLDPSFSFPSSTMALLLHLQGETKKKETIIPLNKQTKLFPFLVIFFPQFGEGIMVYPTAVHSSRNCITICILSHHHRPSYLLAWASLAPSSSCPSSKLGLLLLY